MCKCQGGVHVHITRLASSTGTTLKSSAAQRHHAVDGVSIDAILKFEATADVH